MFGLSEDFEYLEDTWVNVDELKEFINMYAHGNLDDFSSASTELSHLHWIDINEVKSLNLPFITEVVLNEVKEIIKDGPNKKGVPFFKHGASSDFIFIT